MKRFILLADDDSDDQELLADALAEVAPDMGLQVVGTGRELITQLEDMSAAELPCLLVLDFNMPDWNGEKVLEMLCNRPQLAHLPAIIWSTSNSDVHEEICRRKGAKDYVVKPFTLQETEVMCRRILSYCPPLS